ncbi:MAG: hypothetical protein SFU53_03435 [Terrimicrobiaceae bacterium]|nr:hypothetical protein [Terrimicrobiaceae bacterium]
MKQIVGIVLVRNEDRYVGQAVANIASFCDRLILVDHQSKDQTAVILRDAAQAHPAAEFHAISHPRESHELLKPYVGTPTWVFGVDGDEIYDPAGLANFRPLLLSGEFRRHWMIMGNVLHCDALDEIRACGHLAPPSRSITKLYNFEAIERWGGDTPERLHGGSPEFRSGFSELSKRALFEEVGWEDALLRCLHACFVARSTLDRRVASRENIMETYCGGVTNFVRRTFRRMAGRPEDSQWKRERYARGPRVDVDARPFFPART